MSRSSFHHHVIRHGGDRPRAEVKPFYFMLRRPMIKHHRGVQLPWKYTRFPLADGLKKRFLFPSEWNKSCSVQKRLRCDKLKSLPSWVEGRSTKECRICFGPHRQWRRCRYTLDVAKAQERYGQEGQRGNGTRRV